MILVRKARYKRCYYRCSNEPKEVYMEPQNDGKSAKSSKIKTVFRAMLVIMLIVVLVGAGAAAFWWRNDQANKHAAKDKNTIAQLQSDITALKKQLEKQTTTTTTTTKVVATSSTSVQPSQATLDNIKAAFTSKNTAALEGYMAPKVTVVYAASEFGGEKTPAQAVVAMDSVNSGAIAPWNFSLDKTVIANYADGDYSQYFVATTLVGRASNGYVVAVNFDSNGKINGIFVSASDALL